MKAIQVSSLVRSIDQLEVTNLPDLAASKDRYVVQVQAAGTNFFDVLQVQGKHQNKPPLPFIAGNEFAGIVLKTPAESSEHAFKVGERVFGGELGAFATQIYISEQDMRRVPDKWTLLEASGAFLTAPTAYTALTQRAHAKAGKP
jgi:NADPH2:quinone reductase